MYLSKDSKKKESGAANRLNGKPVKKSSELKELVGSLSKALDTLESMREVELQQLLNLHSRMFPKEGIDFYNLTENYEKSLIERALRETKGNQTRAAKLLNLRLTTLNSMIKRYEITY
jgi:transcriptional regulator with GAF, ATPase, and Fis domain